MGVNQMKRTILIISCIFSIFFLSSCIYNPTKEEQEQNLIRMDVLNHQSAVVTRIINNNIADKYIVMRDDGRELSLTSLRGKLSLDEKVTVGMVRNITSRYKSTQAFLAIIKTQPPTEK